MLPWLKALITTDTAQWYETLPFIVGFIFVIIDIGVRIGHDQRPVIKPHLVGYVFSEGITICVIPIYGFALIFNHVLAVAIADKNVEILAVAMFVAFVTLAAHIFDEWFKREAGSAG
jgi:hypothetical protein